MSAEASAAAVSDHSNGNADADFKAAFTLLPHVLKISKAVQTGQNDPQKQQAQIQAVVTDLQVQLQHCHHLLATFPCLDDNPEIQRNNLEAKKEQLRHKCDLLVKYKSLEIFNLTGVSQAKPSYMK